MRFKNEYLRSVLQGAWQGLRAAVFWPERVGQVSYSAFALTCLVLLDMATVVLSGYLALEHGGSFDPSGLAAGCLASALIFIAIGLLSGLGMMQARLSEVAGLSLTVLIVVDLTWAALQYWPAALDQLDQIWPTSLPLAGVSAVWLAVALGHLWGTYAGAFWRHFLVALGALLIIGVPLGFVDRGAPFWLPTPDQTGAESTQAGLVPESLLYGENERLEDAFNSLAVRTPGRINVYFLGFAGNGEQMVFSREVTYVKDLFDSKLAGPGHSLVLMNNPYTQEKVPLASATSLQESLQAIARLMSKDDVLVLFMTSHGSKETGVNVALSPFDFDDIDPALLAQMLDNAHIGHRVIVISACYAGIFLEPLASPDSLVITAADASHTSFGCSNEADFTYFGRAYFADGLAHTHSFTQAFNTALPLIRTREDQEGFEHSNPQMQEGAKIAPILARLEAQWKSDTNLVKPPASS